MKFCPNCEFENFNRADFCERCGSSLYNIQNEDFYFADFIKRNYQIYAIIGIFIVLFTYLFGNSDINVKNASIIPLLITIYLIGFLMLKAGNYSSIRKDGEFEKRIELFAFLFIHVGLILGLIASVGTQYILSIGLLSGFFLALLVSVWRGEIEDRLWKLLLIIVLFLELGLLFVLILPAFLHYFFDPTLFLYYAMIMYALLFFSIGGFFGYLTITFIALLSHHDLSFPELFDEIMPENQIYQLLAGIEILLGLIIAPMLYQIIANLFYS